VIRDARIILLDEPLEGLAPMIVRDLVEVVRNLAAEGRTMIVVEQNVAAALSFANRAYASITAMSFSKALQPTCPPIRT
jgi:branched-chain amino acid transport system ATP-binding protein